MVSQACPFAAALLLGLVVSLSLPATGHSQARPLGTPPPSADTYADRLGDCPVENLRDAWSGMDTLEAVAVEQEVMRLCTERAELTADFLKAYNDLRGAMGDLLPPLPAAAAAAAVGEDGAALSGAGISGTTDVPGLGEERPDLATGDVIDEGEPTDPATVEVAGSEGLDAPSEVREADPADEAEGILDRVASTLGFKSEEEAVATPSEPEIAVLQPPSAESAEITASAPLVTPEPVEPSWQVLFTVRGGDGAWLAALQEVNPLLLLAPLPATDGEDVAALPPVLAPRPPLTVLVGEGEPLSADGPVIVRIDGQAVEIAQDPGGKVEVVPWASGTMISEPGRPDFLFQLEDDAG